MSFFKKAMASVGLGSSKVDAILDTTTIRAGEKVTGKVYIKGGNVEQKIDKIYLKVQTEYIKPTKDGAVKLTETLHKIDINVNSTIQPKQEANIPFQLMLPKDTPVSVGKTKVWISTGLDIKKALDPTDRDHIKVMPHQYMQVVLDALTKLGFRIRETENEYCRNKKGVPFIQEFEFVPTNAFRGQLDELEVVFHILDDGIGLAMEIDRRARGFTGMLAEMFDMDETNTKMAFTHNELSMGSDFIAERLMQYIAQYA